MICEPNDVVSVNVYVSLCVSICMTLYSAVSLVVWDIALYEYKCTLYNFVTLTESGLNKKSIIVLCFLCACINSFPHNLTTEDPQKQNLLKIFWNEKKMLVTSIFSFSHTVF